VSKSASITSLTKRIKQRDAAQLREKVAQHSCVLERRAVSENVAVIFSSDEEQHMLHLAFNEPRCEACVICSSANDRYQSMTLVQQAHWRGHWARMVAFSRLLQRDHVRAGIELLVPYECTRGMDETLFLTPRRAVSEEHADVLAILGWKLDARGRWCADYEPFRVG
jgi:hypothetical protein